MRITVGIKQTVFFDHEHQKGAGFAANLICPEKER